MANRYIGRSLTVDRHHGPIPRPWPEPLVTNGGRGLSHASTRQSEAPRTIGGGSTAAGPGTECARRPWRSHDTKVRWGVSTARLPLLQAAERPQRSDRQQHDGGGLQGENDQRWAPRSRKPPEGEVRDERDLTRDEELPQVGLGALVGLAHDAVHGHEPDDHRERPK
jgi:hypothetical protein